ncbi:MAG: helix-turn-helix domain-containing protein [Clostridia bacterium]|nr:helix-turn-helix domain-containing protein [Clostridia bacterium]
MLSEDDLQNRQEDLGHSEEDVNPAPDFREAEGDSAAETVVYTVPEVALRLRVDIDTVMDLIKTGKLAALYLGSGAGYRVTLADLKIFFQAQKEMTRTAAATAIRQVKTERQTMAGLSNWLKQEKELLADCCRRLNKAVENTVQRLNQNLESSRQNGDHSKIKAINGALFIVFEKWSGPRFDFSNLITKGDRRWREFCSNCPDDGLEVKALWSWLRQEGVISKGSIDTPANYLLPRQQQNLWEERNIYQKQYLWLQQEHDMLVKHYKKMDKAIKKILSGLKAAGKKAGKNMDFYESQVYNDVMLNLYENWEEASMYYNKWLEGFNERWHEFKQEQFHRSDNDNEI